MSVVKTKLDIDTLEFIESLSLSTLIIKNSFVPQHLKHKSLQLNNRVWKQLPSVVQDALIIKFPELKTLGE